jgi:hypothetical protein
MICSRRVRPLIFAVPLALALCMSAMAQESTDLVSSDQTGSAPAGQKTAPSVDNNWHIGVTPYLWFAGSHGTVGAHGLDASYHASFGDIFTKLNIGLMGAAEARKERFVFPVDFLWLKLSDDKGLPLNEIGVSSIKVKATQSIFTPKAGYRVVDQEKLKADVTLGIRYWHLGENLSLEPSLFGGRSQSANWVDVVAGGKIQMPLSPKAMITVLGDAGAGGANVDYQVAGLLGYRIKPKIMMQLGYRYLDVNYRPSSTFIYDAVTSGILLGVTFNLK